MPTHFAAFAALHRATFPTGDLQDGQSIAGYDAVSAAATALRLFEEAKSGGNHDLPQPQDLTTTLLSLNGTHRSVPGAGCDISFARRGADGRDSGNPIGKPIPVLEIPAVTNPVEPHLTRH